MKRVSKVISSTAMILASINLYGAGTTAGIQVDNSVKLTYKIGATDKNATSNTASFVVDNKIDLTVTHQDSAAVAVKSDAVDQVLTFVVKNTGNKVQDYSLTSTQNNGNPFSETDTFDTTNVEIYVDGNANGTYESADDTKTYIDELNPDASITIFIISDMGARSDGDVSEHTLVAQVAEGGASGQGSDITSDDAGSADTAMGVEIVFADGTGITDGAKDGKFSDYSAYKVTDAELTVTKSSCVISDPYNGTTNPKRIPGATVRYAIEIENTSTSTDATNVEVTDTLSSELSYVSGEVYNDECDCNSPKGVKERDTTNSGQDVTANYDTVEQSTKNCAYIDVTIN